jgi:hypothetical protein
LTGVWLIALFTLIFIGTSQIRNFQNESSVTVSNNLGCETCEVLYLRLAEDRYKGYVAHTWDLNNLRVVQVQGEKMMIGKPRLDVEKSGGQDFVVSVRKTSRGRSRENARDYAADLIYNYELKDSVLFFEPYFFLGEKGKWRDQELFITLRVPEGKSIYLDERLVDVIYDVKNVTNTWDGDMIGKYWEMRPEGLTMRETDTDALQ